MEDSRSINGNYGQVFKKFRKEKELSLADFSQIVNKATLGRFENGTTSVTLEKLKTMLEIMDIQLLTFFYISEKIYVNCNYGKIFKLVREQRGYETSDFENICLTDQDIELFEDGKIMFTFDKLEEALENMNLTNSDYIRVLHDGESDGFIEKFQNIEQAYYANDAEKLQKIYEDGISSGFMDVRMISISAKASYTALTDDEQIEVASFLIGIDIWTSFELSVFACVAGQLNINLLRSLAKDFLRQKDYFSGGEYYLHCLMQACFKVIFFFSKEGEIEFGRKALKYAYKLLQAGDETNRLLFQFCYGFWLHQQEDSKGKLKMEKVVEILEFLEDEVLAYKLKKMYKKYIN